MYISPGSVCVYSLLCCKWHIKLIVDMLKIYNVTFFRFQLANMPAGMKKGFQIASPEVWSVLTRKKVISF